MCNVFSFKNKEGELKLYNLKAHYDSEINKYSFFRKGNMWFIILWTCEMFMT
jgi:hypothetical protein